MAQNITIRIAGKEFPLTCSGEESERLMRLAAEEVGKMLAKFDDKMPERSLEDRLCIVALFFAIDNLEQSSKLADMTAGIESLKTDVSSYLESVLK